LPIIRPLASNNSRLLKLISKMTFASVLFRVPCLYILSSIFNPMTADAFATQSAFWKDWLYMAALRFPTKLLLVSSSLQKSKKEMKQEGLQVPSPLKWLG